MTAPVGAIIAGGTGSRMGRLGGLVPKALLPIGDEPVVGHHLKLLRRLGIVEVFIVVGHLGHAIREVVGDGGAYGLTVTWIDQGDALGSAHAVGRLRTHISGPFVLLLGDYYFVSSEPERLLARLDQGHSVVTVRPESDLELISQACEVRVDDAGRVIDLIEKPSRPIGALKGCGVYALHPDVFDSIALTPRTALRNEYELTHALAHYSKQGRPMFAEAILEADTNLTSPRDVVRSNVSWLGERALASYVAPTSTIGDGVELESVVVGERARIDGRGTLTDVVVFPDASMTVEADVKSSIVLPSGLLQC